MTDKKIIKCGLCDANVIVPEDTERGFGFALHLIECEVCGATCGGGNGLSGEVSRWVSVKQTNRAMASIHAMEMDAFNNEFYGRGNW
tara:strand:- start:188 stop:448 length:261 start_codon:yes stop_codon:yes gene_type:complete